MSDQVFTYGPANVGTLLATTLSNIRKELTDNVFNSNPFFAWLNSKGKASLSGGATIVVPVMSGKNTTANAYDGADVIDTTLQGGITAAQYQWRQYAVTVGLTGREMEIQNASKEQIISLVTAKVMQAEMSLEDRLAIDLFATSQNSKKIITMATMVDATSTIGDINSTSNAFWQAVVTTSGSFAAQGLSDLRTTWNTLSRVTPRGTPDFIMSDQTNFERYEATVLPHLRIQNEQMGDLGFTNLKFKGATWMFDTNATSAVIYLLNSDRLNLTVHTNRNFTTGEWVEPTDQDVKTKKIYWAGQLTCDARRKLGKLISLTA